MFGFISVCLNPWFNTHEDDCALLVYFISLWLYVLNLVDIQHRKNA